MGLVLLDEEPVVRRQRVRAGEEVVRRRLLLQPLALQRPLRALEVLDEVVLPSEFVVVAEVVDALMVCNKNERYKNKNV